MAKNRNTFRQHIRAAREWLGRAENSLDKENDIRGDLNLMLAQAELQRAKESNGLARKPSWNVRLAPLAMHDFLSLEYVIDKNDSWLRLIGVF